MFICKISTLIEVELAMFDFITVNLPVHSDEHQRKMGLSYVTLPTTLLVYEITDFALISGYVLCKTEAFLHNMNGELCRKYVQHKKTTNVEMTAEIGDLAKTISKKIVRQIA